MNMPWPHRDNPVVEARYELVAGFNDKGEPVCRGGVDDDPERMRGVTETLESLKPVPASVTSVTMGHVTLVLRSGEELTLRPVFRISAEVYGDLFKIREYDLPMPDGLADLLNDWRKELKEP